MLIIVTDAMEAAIKRDLDAARDSLPESDREAFDAERHYHRQEIINFVGDNGYYPQVGSATKQTPPTQQGE